MINSDTAFFILLSLSPMNIHNSAYLVNVNMTYWQSCVTEYIRIVIGVLTMHRHLNYKQTEKKKTTQKTKHKRVALRTNACALKGRLTR